MSYSVQGVRMVMRATISSPTKELKPPGATLLFRDGAHENSLLTGNFSLNEAIKAPFSIK